MALITLDHVSKIYPKGSRPALDDVSLDIQRGDFVFLVGASGSGKTTLLSLLLREEEATEGEIRVAGSDLRRMPARQIPQYRRSIGFIFQDYKLLANKTVWQNVAFALEVIGTRRSTIRSLVPQVLKTVGLTGKESNYPHELSGGEQQRVAIARAYVNHPQILLADEPTGNLDPTTSLGIMEVLDAINRTGTTIVMATHNEEIVNSMRKRVVELKAGRIMRDEEQGSYDSALFFPDADVATRAHEAINGDGTPAAELALPEGDDADPTARTNAQGSRDAAASAVDKAAAEGLREVSEALHNTLNGDDGIARLANSVHSGRTGRYGEVFQSVETTLTWGRGLPLDELRKQDAAKNAKNDGTKNDTAKNDAVRNDARPEAHAADPDAKFRPGRAAAESDAAKDEAPEESPKPAPASDAARSDAAHGETAHDHAPAGESRAVAERPSRPAPATLAPPAPPAPPARRPQHDASRSDASHSEEGAER